LIITREGIPKKIKSNREDIITKSTVLPCKRQALMHEQLWTFLEKRNADFVEPFFWLLLNFILLAVELLNNC
jgi:hypothetical protein